MVSILTFFLTSLECEHLDYVIIFHRYVISILHMAPVESPQVVSVIWNNSLFVNMYRLSPTIEEAWPSLKPTGFIRTMKSLTVNLRKRMCTADILAKRVLCFS